jgi:hypothetical protein
MFSFGVLALLAGCATGPMSAPGTFLPPEHNLKLAQAKPCCSSLANIPYTKLTHDHEQSATLSPESQVFEFSSGRSFFSAFELPVNSRVIVLKTYPVNMLLNRTGHVLLPAVQFLDVRHQVVETVAPTYSTRSPRVIGDSWAEAGVPVPVSARYFIILDSKSPGGLAWRDADQRSGSLFVRSGPTGEATVLVRGF